MKAINIIWDTDGEVVNLPTEMEFPNELFDGGYNDDVTNYLCDRTGWCVVSFDIVE